MIQHVSKHYESLPSVCGTPIRALNRELAVPANSQAGILVTLTQLTDGWEEAEKQMFNRLP